MKKYAKVIDEETKACIVAIGEEACGLYHAENFTVQEVEQSFDGRWFLAGYAPEKSDSILKQERIEQLQAYLNETDWYVVRFSETGVEMPSEVLNQRQAARDEISNLREESAA